jgi:hypothetical protein
MQFATSFGNSASKQRRGQARRRIQQILVRERPLRIDDRCSSAMLLGVNKKQIPTGAADHVQTLRLLRIACPPVRTSLLEANARAGKGGHSAAVGGKIFDRFVSQQRPTRWAAIGVQSIYAPG